MGGGRGEPISPREAEVLALVADHRTNAEIAELLYISERTVESHVSALLRKTRAADRRALAREHVARAVPPTPRAPALPPALAMLADADTYVGRHDELGLLLERWRAACDGRTLGVVVGAEAGMGKTRLVAELAAQVAASGGQVLLGACHEDVDAPYGPFADVIADDASRLDDATRRRRAEAAGGGLAALSPELARLLGADGTGRPDRRAEELDRAAVVDGIRHWLVDAATTCPLLLVLEDLHWATATTRDALRHVVRRGGRAPMLVVATARDQRPDLDDELARLVADLEATATVARLSLAGLDVTEVAALLRTSVDVAGPVHAATGGNPLLARHAAGRGRAAETLPMWLVRRDASLEPEARELLDLAAVIGVEFDADLLAAAQSCTLLRALELLEHAEAAGLVQPRPGRRSEFTFVHALFRSHRVEELSPRRRIELHAKVAAALARRPDDRTVGERARHACLAVPLVDAREAVELSRAAAARDERSHAYDEAGAHYRRALDAVRLLEPPDPALERALEVGAAAALHQRGRPEGLPMLLEVARRAQHAGDTDALVTAALAIPLFGAVGFMDPLVEGRVITQAALDALGPDASEAKARLMMDLASHWLFVDVDEAIGLGRVAEAIARDLGDPVVLGAVLLGERHLHSHPARLAERLRIADELEHLGARLGALPLTLAGAATRALADYERAELVAWTAGFDRFLDLLGDRTLPFFQAQGIVHQAQRAFLRGHLEQAESIAAGSVPWSRGIGAGRIYQEGIVVANRRLQGRDDELVERFERATSRSEELWYRCALAAAQARAGHVEAAAASLDVVRERGVAVRTIYPWSVAMSDLAEAAEIVGDSVVAEHVLAAAAPFAGRIGLGGPNPGRPFDQVLAQAALGAGDAARAVDHAARAVAASRGRTTPLFLARELVFLAEARRRVGATTAQVRRLVAEAIELADPSGARVVRADVERYGLDA